MSSVTNVVGGLPIGAEILGLLPAAPVTLGNPDDPGTDFDALSDEDIGLPHDVRAIATTVMLTAIDIRVNFIAGIFWNRGCRSRIHSTEAMSR